jgi:hypothetical protein
MEIRPAMNNHVSIQAHPRYLVATDAAALATAEILLFALSRINALMSPLALRLLAAGLLAGFAADIGLWFWKGIRAAEITGERLTVYRGGSLLPETYGRGVTVIVKISRLPGNRSARLRTMSGRRLRITENAFAAREFSRFLAALRRWPHRKGGT